jgi:hypothetical protein
VSVLQVLEYIELDIDWCTLRYGEGACTAVLGVDSTIKCFNTAATCAVRAAYKPAPVTLRFAKPADYRPAEPDALPSIVSVEFTPAKIEPGENLGSRPALKVSFRDSPHSDTGPGFDKYHAERDYNPFEQGSLWSKFRARQPFLRGEPIRWITGFVGDDIADMETRHFLVESFDGPTPEGIYTLIARDPLKLADGDRSNAPAASKGVLNASISAAATTAALAPAGIGDAAYPASGFLNVGGKEIVAFTRSGDDLTLTRAQQNTTAVAHDADERMQVCRNYDGWDPADAIYDLLVNDAGVDATWCDLPTWRQEISAYLRRDYTRFIAEPTSVNELVSDLMLNAGLSIWTDDVAKKIRLQVLRQISTDAAVFDDSLIVEGSFRVKEQPTLRASQVWCSYAQTNPLKEKDAKDNYRSKQVTVDTENEENYGQAAIKKITAPWIAFGGSSAAERACDLQIGRYGRPPRLFSFSLFRGAQDAPQLGGGYQIEARVLQDATGAAERVPVQLVQVKPTPTGWDVTALEMRYLTQDSDDVASKTITIDVNANSVNLRTLHDRLFPDPVAGDHITCIIKAGVRLGATNTSAPAFDTGTWPTVVLEATGTLGSPTLTGLSSTEGMAEGMAVTGLGVPNHARIISVGATDITLDQDMPGTATGDITVHTVILDIQLLGRIQGAGGRGGRGKTHNGALASAGSPGGTALKVRHPINLSLDEGAAEVWSGGGGGGGAGVLNLDQHKGGGGGGGAGIVAGGGGASDYQAGASGGANSGGQGGSSYASWAFSQWPYDTQVRGGTGGAPGQNGSAGGNHGGSNANEPGNGAGGLAGAAIDGNSLAKRLGTGNVRGRLIN